MTIKCLHLQIVDTPKRQAPGQPFNQSEQYLTCRHLQKTSHR